MQKSECFELGYIAKSHGLDGKVQAIFDVEDLSFYLDIESVFVERKGTLVPFFIEYFEVLDNQKVLLRFEDISGKNDADELKGSKLFLPLSFLPNLDEGEHYLHELVGFEVFDVEKGFIGISKDFVEAGPQLIMVVLSGDKEILIPYHEDFLIEVSETEKKIKMNLPNGLVDLYLTEE